MTQINDTVDVKPDDKPSIGKEKTKAQQVYSATDVYSVIKTDGQYSKPLPGTFQTYRKMRANPTIAMARAIATAPILRTNWVYIGSDDSTDEMVTFIKEVIKPLIEPLIQSMILAFDYGFQAFEKVFEIKQIDGRDRIVYKKIKALAPGKTQILVDDHGSFAGLKQEAIELSIANSMVFTYDNEFGNFYGRSRHENVRENAWKPWMDLIKQENRYVNKISGVIPIIEYPPGGEETDENGQKQTAFEMAAKVLQNLGQGNGVAMPNTFAKYADDLSRAGVDIGQLKAWSISFLETTGRHGDQFVSQMRHKESLMMRGWLVPERTATEGQSGTKAEAGVHGAVALSIAEIDLALIKRSINWFVIEPLLAMNFGEEFRKAVKIESEPLSDAEKLFFRELLVKVLGDSSNIDLLLATLDMDGMMDLAGLPKVEDNIDNKNLLNVVGRNNNGDNNDVPGDDDEVVKKIFEKNNAARGNAKPDN